MISESMTHTCGGCTMCCKLIGVQELEKPPNKWCKFCTPGKCCNIYPDRPQSCVDFECGWLLSNLPMEFRPDNLHIIITGDDNKIGAAILHQDPRYPNAIHSKNGKRLVQFFANNEKSIILVTGDKRTAISHSIRDTERIQQILKDNQEE